MKKIKAVIGFLAVVGGLLAIFFVLRDEKALLTHPKGIIAHRQWQVISTNYIIMFTIVIPVFIFLGITVLKYRSRNSNTKEQAKQPHRFMREWMLWVIPMPFVAVLIYLTWNVAHELDPFVPIKSEHKPITIQVVALDWKWLFIYPEQEIATVNFVQFPVHIPVNFRLAADGSPMNSFWIPQLSGQIYAMTGMVTPLHIKAHEIGEYSGRAAEINGKGYASMTFVAKATSEQEFDQWVTQVKKSSLKLTEKEYTELLNASEKHPITLYSHVLDGLFDKIVMKYMFYEQKK